MAVRLFNVVISALAGTLVGSATGATTGYVQENLVSDQAGVASHTDTNAVNAWGLTAGRRTLWVNNAGTGTLVPYSVSGVPRRPVVNIPSASAEGGAAPTGLELNATRAFVITNRQVGPSAFLAATEQGTIAAWNPAGGTAAVTVVDRSGVNAVYKGLAIVPDTNGAPLLAAADFRNARVDLFDGQFQLLRSFTDPEVPAGFAPFNVKNIRGHLVVTFAKQLPPDAEDDEAGPGNGYVDIMDTDGTVLRRFASQGALNSPWGLAIAPRNFGQFSGALLVGNFGDGRINAYDLFTGKHLGNLKNRNGGDLVIDGLWALEFDRQEIPGRESSFTAGGLFFTAGPNDEENGLVGVIRPARRSNPGTGPIGPVY